MLRALLMGGEIRESALLAATWCSGLAVLGYLWARAAFSRRRRR